MEGERSLWSDETRETRREKPCPHPIAESNHIPTPSICLSVALNGVAVLSVITHHTNRFMDLAGGWAGVGIITEKKSERHSVPHRRLPMPPFVIHSEYDRNAWGLLYGKPMNRWLVEFHEAFAFRQTLRLLGTIGKSIEAGRTKQPLSSQQKRSDRATILSVQIPCRLPIISRDNQEVSLAMRRETPATKLIPNGVDEDAGDGLEGHCLVTIHPPIKPKRITTSPIPSSMAFPPLLSCLAQYPSVLPPLGVKGHVP